MTAKKAITPLLILMVLAGSLLLHRQTGRKENGAAFFVRENAFWTLYSIKDGQKIPTGLSVPHQENPYATGTGEDMYAALSPNGEKIAFMQKPAWPHTLFIANADGSHVKELFTPKLPAHAFIENGFFWDKDNAHLYFAVTSSDGGPFDGSETGALFKINTETGVQTEIATDTHTWENESEFQPTKVMPVGNL